MGLNGETAKVHANPSQSPGGEINGHEILEITDDDGTPLASSQQCLETILAHVPGLSFEHLEEVTATVTARKCFVQQEDNLAEFVNGFAALCDPDFKANHSELLAGFADMVNGMKLKITEQAWESTSSRTGTVTLALPGLPDGVTVTRGTDTFFVDEGNTLLERNEVRVKLGGLDVYSGYWLAVDAPSANIEDPLQEEGIDTLRRVMEAAGILKIEAAYEDAMEYPFLSALLSPFGPEAIIPFEEHLRSMHGEYGQKHGGSWFKMASRRKSRSTLEQVPEVEGAEGEGEEETDEVHLPPPRHGRRRQLTEAEEADLELDRLDL